MGYFTDELFDNAYDMIDSINEVVERNVRENFERTSADKLGLDIRAGYTVYVNKDFVVTQNRRTLDYYGGFEYIDAECITTFGDYTFYSGDCERVRECIEAFYEQETQEEVE
jgi:hypothetical protein